ncbi:MAG: hypothetical protein AAB649_00420 [Patescibacteria group bacterium]
MKLQELESYENPIGDAQALIIRQKEAGQLTYETEPFRVLRVDAPSKNNVLLACQVANDFISIKGNGNTHIEAAHTAFQQALGSAAESVEIVNHYVRYASHDTVEGYVKFRSNGTVWTSKVVRDTRLQASFDAVADGYRYHLLQNYGRV